MCVQFAKRLGNIAENASKKSNAMMEAARLKGEINRITGEIEDLQFELGKAYYEDNKTKTIGPYFETIEKIGCLEREIFVRNEKLLAQKGLVYCVDCGAVIAIDDGFCNKCGAPVPKEKRPVETVICRNCGEENEEDTEYCDKCGIAL